MTNDSRNFIDQRVRLIFCKMALIASSFLLTSFETILLDCILTAVLSACIKIKNLTKIGEFLCRY